MSVVKETDDKTHYMTNIIDVRWMYIKLLQFFPSKLTIYYYVIIYKKIVKENRLTFLKGQRGTLKVRSLFLIAVALKAKRRVASLTGRLKYLAMFGYVIVLTLLLYYTCIT